MSNNNFNFQTNTKVGIRGQTYYRYLKKQESPKIGLYDVIQHFEQNILKICKIP